jgi:hypothetical protein
MKNWIPAFRGNNEVLRAAGCRPYGQSKPLPSKIPRRGRNLRPVTGLDSRLRGNDEWGDAKALISRLLTAFAGITGDTVFIIF